MSLQDFHRYVLVTWYHSCHDAEPFLMTLCLSVNGYMTLLITSVDVKLSFSNPVFTAPQPFN